MPRILLMAILISLAGCGDEAAFGFGGRKTADKLEIKVLSNRPDLISGGDALVEIVLPAGADASKLGAAVDGRDVSDQFALRPNGRVMALLSGLADGPNVLSAKLGEQSGSLTLINHPNGGPVFAGEQIQPWPCMEGAVDAQCNRPVRYEFYYQSSSPAPAVPCAQEGVPAGCGAFKPYDPQNPPSDVAMTTTDQGRTVPYIVRVEIGTQDRGQYRIAALFDPAKDWKPWAPQDGWNGKTVNVGGLGCGTLHGEAAAPTEALYADALALGYIGWSTALSFNQQNCNLVVHAESLMMAKERIVEQYGPIRYTLARGGSGGSIKQQQAANSYPGIFDGIIPEASFPDSWSTMQEVDDCSLLIHYFTHPEKWTPGVVWDETLMAAVSGHLSISVCHTWVTQSNFNQLMNPASNASCGVADQQRYDAQARPEGERCSLQDYMVSILGRRPPEQWGVVEQKLGRGFANKPWDNVGVQYGLAALKKGVISAAQFVDLNAGIGSHDIDYQLQPERAAADPAALAVAYRGGLINEGTNMRLPVIDGRGYDLVDIHHTYRSFAMRDRLDRAHGHHDNQQIWLGPSPAASGALQWYGLLFVAMDEWLAALEADASELSYDAKVVKNLPASAAERCTEAIGQTLPNELCPLLYPSDASPRIVAGAPFGDDIVKCQLKPLLPSEYYPVTFTDAQWARLRQAFPGGICNYELPGVEQQPTVPWMDYSAGPGGVPMPPMPAPEGWASPVFRTGY